MTGPLLSLLRRPSDFSSGSNVRKSSLRMILGLAALMLAAVVAKADTLPLPGQNDTNPSFARGYYFEAPVGFMITGASVVGATGTQYVEIVSFPTTPALYGTGTPTSFTVLGYSSGASGTTLPEGISVTAGQIIGVLGYDGGCGCINYGDDGYVSSIFGQSFTLKRLIAQQSLDTPADEIDADTSVPSIGLVELEYSAPITPPAVAATPEPSSLALLGTGALAVAGIVRRRMRR